MTRLNFKKGIAILTSAFPERFGEFSKDNLRIWFTLLADIDDRVWERTILFIARNHSKPPVPATIRKIALDSEELEPEEAWGMVTDAVRSCGRYSLPHFADEGLNKAIRAIGWHQICDCNIDELSGLRAHFFRTYKATQKRVQIDKEYKALENPQMKRLIGMITKDDSHQAD